MFKFDYVRMEELIDGCCKTMFESGVILQSAYWKNQTPPVRTVVFAVYNKVALAQGMGEFSVHFEWSPVKNAFMVSTSLSIAPKYEEGVQSILDNLNLIDDRISWLAFSMEVEEPIIERRILCYFNDVDRNEPDFDSVAIPTISSALKRLIEEHFEDLFVLGDYAKEDKSESLVAH